MALVSGGLLVLWAFIASPNMSNAFDEGVGNLIQRVREQPMDGVVMLGELLFALGEFAAAYGLLTGKGGRALVAVALGFVVVELVGVALTTALGAAASGWH